MLIKEWRRYVGEPDDQVELWLCDGSPLGIVARPVDRGIFPLYTDAGSAVVDPASLASETLTGRAFKAAADPDAISEISTLVSKNWLKRFSSKAQAKRFVKGKLILSDLIVITKVKRSRVKGKLVSKTKKRLILNLKKSGVTAVAVKAERPELPRVLDVIFANLELLKKWKKRWRKRSLRHVVLDFANAFFHFPTREDERRFFATRLGKDILVWMRTAQGSRGAPLVCGTALALIMRLASATIPKDEMSASTYVDDPISTFIGDKAQQDINIGKLIGSTHPCGFDLAFAKAQYSDTEPIITWTSARLELLDDEPGLKVTVKEDILTEVSADIEDMMRFNSVLVDKLRTLAGRATCISSLIHVWRPFVSMLWVPIYNTRSRCPFDPDRVWRSAVEVPLRWMRAFLAGTHGTLSRTYTLAAYRQEGDQYTVVTDASPLGLGAFLVKNGVITEFAFGTMNSIDEEVLKVKMGGSEGQQVWESLILLAALRLWSLVWRGRRITLAVQSDSVSALIMLIKMKADGIGTALISRELALDIAEAVYQPNVGSHIPGVTNVLADHLSRRLDDSAPLPAPLRHARRRWFPHRAHHWWRTL